MFSIVRILSISLFSTIYLNMSAQKTPIERVKFVAKNLQKLVQDKIEQQKYEPHYTHFSHRFAYQRTPLHMAALENKPIMVRAIIRQLNTLYATQSDPQKWVAHYIDSPDSFGNTAFTYAIQKKNHIIAQQLLSNLANVHTRDTNGHTALHTAFQNQDYKSAQIILKVEAELLSTFYTVMHSNNPVAKQCIIHAWYSQPALMLLSFTNKEGKNPVDLCTSAQFLAILECYINYEYRLLHDLEQDKRFPENLREQLDTTICGMISYYATIKTHKLIKPAFT